MTAVDYRAFIDEKSHLGTFDGFSSAKLPSFLFDFQAHLTDWALRKGRAAILADCGLGKAPMGLVWADQIVQRTNKPVLVLTPIAVSQQLVREGEKFGIDVERCADGKVATPRVITTNYERLHYFDPNDFGGVACDESSILKSFDGVRRQAITSFMRKLRYRLLLTATAAPNDYIELGTSSEALGELGYMDMLSRFFKSETGSIATRHFARGEVGEAAGEKWRFKGHAETPFWRWVASWARALRRPSDLGFADDGFVLPQLDEVEHVVAARTAPDGMLFSIPVVGLKEQREEQRRTVEERCEKASELVRHDQPAIAWCHLNAEGDLLERLIPDAVQVSGKDSDDAKEEKLLAFADGKVRVLITKPKIGAWGLNLQHCAHLTYFPTHSFEQYYQSVRRCWRYGQKRAVRVDAISTEGQAHVGANRQRKALKADRMFSELVAHMNEAVALDRARTFATDEVSPPWL